MSPESAPAPAATPEVVFARQSEALRDLRLDTQEGIERLRYVVDYPPDAPPADASKSLQETHQSLVREHELLSKNGDVQSLLTRTKMSPDRAMLLAKILEDFRKKVVSYEDACIESVTPAFLTKLGVGNADARAFAAFRESLAEPIPAVPAKDDTRFNDKQRSTLTAERRELEAVRQGESGSPGLSVSIENQLLNMWMGVEDQNSPQDWKDFRKTLAIFAARKQRYEQEILLKKPASPMWAVFAGMAVEEAAEEGVESLKFGKKPMLLRTADVARIIPGVSAETRVALLQADHKMQRMLKLKGVTKIPLLGDVLKTANKTPFGSKMFRQLLEVESPFTVLFYAYYLHSSDNKIKATMNYAMFMASSAASGALLETVGLMLQSERLLATVGPRGAALLTKIAKIPGHPVLKFVAAIGFVYLGSEYLDQFTSWLDEKIPHTAERFRNEMILTMMSGDALIGDAAFAYGELIPASIDPEKDRFSYLSTELPTITMSEGLDSRFMNDEQAWNDKVRSNIEDPHFNPLKKKFWELETIDSAWYKREAAHLYEEVSLMRKMESEIGAELCKRTYTRNGPTGREKVPVLSDPRMLKLSNDVTEDSGYMRLDRNLAILLDNPEHTAGRINAYISTLDDADSLKNSWKEYKVLAGRVAKSVTVYRNLKYANYNRQKWIGNGKEVPDMVEDGYVEELAYMLKRGDVYEAAAKDAAISRETYARSLARMVKPETDTRTVLGMEVQSAKGVYAVKALSEAAEAAASYLPKTLDANILFKDIQQLAKSDDKATVERIRAVRDQLTDAVRLHAEHTKAGAYVPASRALRSKAGLTVFSKVFSSIDVRDPALLNDPILQTTTIDALVGTLLEGTVAVEAQKDRHDGAVIALAQCVIPENGLAIMSYASVLPRGPDLKDWRVRTRRCHMAKQTERGQKPHVFEQENEAGFSDEITLVEWLAVHPSAAALLQGDIKELQRKEQYRRKEYDSEMTLALARAKKSPDTFIALPILGQHILPYQKGVAILTRTPQKRSYRNSVEEGFGANQVDDYTLIIREPGKPDRNVSINRSVVRDYKNQPPEMQQLIDNVLTTPIEENDEASLAAVFNVFDTAYSTVSNAGYAFGYRPTMYAEELEKNLLPLFSEAKNKKYFLERILNELRWRGGTVTYENSIHLSAWFEKNKELFQQGTKQDCLRFDAGDRILGYPDAEGLYKHVEGPIKTYFYYNVGAHEWQWCVDGKQWVSVKESFIPSGENKYRSPGTDALNLIEKLRVL